LIGGNPNASPADYDLAKSIEGLDGMKLQVVSLGSPTVIMHKEKRPPWTERYSMVIWIVLLVAVGVMVGFIIKNFKKLPAPKE
jgi:preprotein translocase subunit Sss1